MTGTEAGSDQLASHKIPKGFQGKKENSIKKL